MALDRQRHGGRGWHAVTHGGQASVQRTAFGTGHKTHAPQYVSPSGATAVHLFPRTSDEFPRMTGPSSDEPAQPQRAQASPAVEAIPTGTTTAARPGQQLPASTRQHERQHRGAASSPWHHVPSDSPGLQPLRQGGSHKVAAQHHAAGAALAASLADQFRAAELKERDEDWQGAAAAQLNSMYSWAGKSDRLVSAHPLAAGNPDTHAGV